MLGHLCGFDRNFVVMKYTAEMKAHRKIVAPLLTGASLDLYAYIQQEEAALLALDCILDSSKLRDHVTLYGLIDSYRRGSHSHHALFHQQPKCTSHLENHIWLRHA